MSPSETASIADPLAAQDETLAALRFGLSIPCERPNEDAFPSAGYHVLAGSAPGDLLGPSYARSELVAEAGQGFAVSVCSPRPSHGGLGFLTTVEFFQLVRANLTEHGVAVVNAGVGPDGDTRLGNAIATTMSVVFPQVYIIDTPRFGNQIIVGTNRDEGDGLVNFVANYGRTSDPSLRAVMETVVARRFDPAEARFEPFTDDKAPVEALIDSLIFETVLP
mgnify:CR=1 FL=1